MTGRNFNHKWGMELNKINILRRWKKKREKRGKKDENYKRKYEFWLCF